MGFRNFLSLTSFLIFGYHFSKHASILLSTFLLIFFKLVITARWHNNVRNMVILYHLDKRIVSLGFTRHAHGIYKDLGSFDLLFNVHRRLVFIILLCFLWRWDLKLLDWGIFIVCFEFLLLSYLSMFTTLVGFSGLLLLLGGVLVDFNILYTYFTLKFFNETLLVAS